MVLSLAENSAAWTEEYNDLRSSERQRTLQGWCSKAPLYPPTQLCAVCEKKGVNKDDF